jgi:hypothetical protein
MHRRPSNSAQPIEPQRHPGLHLTRPRRWVVGVATVVLIVGLANVARGALAIAYALRLPELPMTIGWEYLAATGLFWGLLLTGCSFSLAGFYRWARAATLAAATTFQLHVWVNHLLYDANDYARQTWPWDLVLTALFLAIVWTILGWPGIRREFARAEGGLKSISRDST